MSAAPTHAGDPSSLAIIRDVNSSRFNAWFHSLSPTNRKVEICTVEGMGRGVFAVAEKPPIRKMDRIIAVP